MIYSFLNSASASRIISRAIIGHTLASELYGAFMLDIQAKEGFAPVVEVAVPSFNIIRRELDVVNSKRFSGKN